MKCKECALCLDCLRAAAANDQVLDIHKDRSCREFVDRIFGVSTEGPPWEVGPED